MSTGYIDKLKSRQQPSSSGQIVAMSSGSQRTYKDGSIVQVSSGANLNIYGTASATSGGVVNVDDGGTFRLRANSVPLDQTYNLIAAGATGGTLSQRGISYLAPTSSENVYTLPAPQNGAMKTIVISANSSVATRIVSSSGVAIGGAGGTSGPFAIVSDSDVRANSVFGNHITLQATGTARWRVVDVGSTVDLSLTTALT